MKDRIRSNFTSTTCHNEKKNTFCSFFSCEKQKVKIKWKLNICKIIFGFCLHVSTEIANIHAHKVISDAFFYFQIP